MNIFVGYFKVFGSAARTSPPFFLILKKYIIYSASFILVGSNIANAQVTDYWYVSKTFNGWSEPSHLAVALHRTESLICGLIHSSAMGANRIDKSLLFGKVTNDKMEVYYTSSYFQGDAEIGKALLFFRGSSLVWEPLDEHPSRSWFWGKAELERTAKPYTKFATQELKQCKEARAKQDAGNLVGSDLYLEQ